MHEKVSVAAKQLVRRRPQALRWVCYTGVFALALSLRMIFVSQWLATPYAGSPLLDAHTYDQWAQDIAGGAWLRDRAFYQSPLYPYCLALLYKIFGHNTSIVSYAQAVIGASTCVLVSLVSEELGLGLLASTISGLMIALYRPAVFFTAPLMKETLGLALLTFFVYASLKSLRGRAAWIAVSGVALGLTALTRGNALLLAPIAAVALWILHPRKQNSWAPLLGVGLLALSVTLTILPATIHNYVTSHDYVLINSTGGFNFYLGHSPLATGANNYPPDVSSQPEQEELDTTRIAERDLNRSLKPSEVSKYWSDRGLHYLLSHPGEEIAATINKVIFLFNNYEQTDNYDISFVSTRLGTVLRLPLVGFGLLVIFACVGFLSTVGSSSISTGRGDVKGEFADRRLYMAALGFIYAASVVLFYVTDRYRLPLIVFLLPFAGAAGPGFLALVRERRLGRITSTALAGTLAAVLGFLSLPASVDTLDAFNWGVLAGAESDQGHDENALTDIELALAASPRSVHTDALVKASTSAERLGRLSLAEALLKKAIEAHPDDGFTYYNYGRFRFEHGDAKTARDLFARAQSMMPWRYQPYIGLAVCEFQLGNLTRARELTHDGLKLNPQSPELNQLAKRFPASSP